MSMLRKPKYHIFGHIHEAQGMQKENGITFINVAKQPTRFILWLDGYDMNILNDFAEGVCISFYGE